MKSAKIFPFEPYQTDLTKIITKYDKIVTKSISRILHSAAECACDLPNPVGIYIFKVSSGADK